MLMSYGAHGKVKMIEPLWVNIFKVVFFFNQVKHTYEPAVLFLHIHLRKIKTCVHTETCS